MLLRIRTAFCATSLSLACGILISLVPLIRDIDNQLPELTGLAMRHSILGGVIGIVFGVVVASVTAKMRSRSIEIGVNFVAAIIELAYCGTAGFAVGELISYSCQALYGRSVPEILFHHALFMLSLGAAGVWLIRSQLGAAGSSVDG